MNVICLEDEAFYPLIDQVINRIREQQGIKEYKWISGEEYYDPYCLLEAPEVLAFIGTEAYFEQKKALFPKKDLEIPISKNEAFMLSNPENRAEFKARYQATESLYYKSQVGFNILIDKVGNIFCLLITKFVGYRLFPCEKIGFP